MTFEQMGPMPPFGLAKQRDSNCRHRLPGFFSAWGFDAGDIWPSMDVVYAGRDLFITIQLENARPEDIEIDLEEGLLTISGRHGPGSFFRTLLLEESVSENDITASMRDGNLHISIRGAARVVPGRKIIPVTEEPL